MEGFMYYSSLLACIIFSSYYKKIVDIEIKRSFGSGLGILIACLICGLYVVYALILVWGNVIILKCCEKRYVHKISLLYTWTFLFYFYSNIESTKYVKWIMQTVSLRMVGLAFEIKAPEGKADPSRATLSTLKINDENDATEIKLNAAEVISYAFYFIGLHKGPYYRWKIFNDHFSSPFSGLGDCRFVTEQKIKRALLFALGYWLLNMKYSADVSMPFPKYVAHLFTLWVYTDNDFYRNYNTDYRFVYNFPLLMIFFFEHQIIMMLCTAVCTETGFGVYPTKCHPTPGHGPTKQFSLLKLASGDTEVALKQDYNFEMLRTFDNQKLLMGPKMKDTLRGWDMPTRYWFWSNIYKNLVKSNKEVRSACSFLAWTIFKGPTKQQVILSITLWAYVHLESDYSTLYHTSKSMKRAWDFGFTIMRIICLVYLAPCFIVTNTEAVIRYYNSIYWVFHIVLTILTLAALFMYKSEFLVPVNVNVPKPAGKSSILDFSCLKLRKESSGNVNRGAGSTAATVSASPKTLPEEPPSTSH